MKFRESIRRRRLFFDGGMGSLLQNRVEDMGSIPEELVLTHPEVIRQIHQEYVAAGANIITTCTFGAGEYKLKNSRYTQKEIVEAAVRLARDVNPDYVALDIGPVGALIGPIGEISFEEAYTYFANLIDCGVQAGVDVLLIETMTDIYEAKAALLAAKEHAELPIIVSMTYEENGRTLTGSDPLTAVTILESLGADVIGVNCSTGPDKMLPIVEDLLTYSSVPVLVQPNAGLPRVVDGQTCYDITAQDFAFYMKQMAEKGVTLLGGCCGTTPEYIEKTIEAVTEIPVIHRTNDEFYKMRVATSTSTITIDKDICVVGECINPTTNADLKEELRRGDLSLLKKLAVEQKRKGAQILDINLGLPEIDEKSMMLQAICAVSEMVDIPLQIDTSDPEIIEAVLRCYNGKPIINSVNGDPASMHTILPIVKKYGACVLGLAMDEGGIPETAEQRLVIAERIINTAANYGIEKKNVLIDCLVLTASAQQEAVQETLKAVRLVNKRLQVPVTLGVSNISFGLPNRPLMNRTFLTLALEAGITAPIINPFDDAMMDTIMAYRGLKSLDIKCKDYVRYCGNAEKTTISSVNLHATDDLKTLIVEGDSEAAAEVTKKLLETVDPMAIVNDYLIPGLDIVGEQFETGEAFLPNLMFAAEAVQASFAIIKQQFDTQDQLSKGKILLATVAGDVHDIGKNILKVILENYGYSILDLGKDVPVERIIDHLQRENIRLVGLSALMTTTVKNMEATIQKLREECPDVLVMVGGAVMNPEYAKAIGADFYGKDAKAGVEIAQKVFETYEN